MEEPHQEKPSKDGIEILNLVWELKFKIILFWVSILSFVALIGTFIFVTINQYDWQIITAVGASDSLFGYVIFHITKSLFKPK